ncbi:hypothetical protein SMICM304S_08207 [Streptomyces microflavus]
MAALVEAFRARERLPHLEFLPDWAPAVEPALLAAGFTVENRAPLLACGREDLRTPKPVEGLRITVPAPEAEFTDTARVQHQGFGGKGRCPSRERPTGCARRPPVTGWPPWRSWAHQAGAGGCSVAVDGLSELAGLAVAAPFRRRGVGAALTAWLTERALNQGCRTVWLEPGDPDVERIYAGVGYRRIGEKLNISLEPPHNAIPRAAGSGARAARPEALAARSGARAAHPALAAQARRRAVAHRVSSCRLESWSLRSTAETWDSTVFAR